MTGNGTYWASFPISNIFYTGAYPAQRTITTGLNTSGNFPGGSSYVIILYRVNGDFGESGNDPLVNVGDWSNTPTNRMWQEAGHSTDATFKNSNGGIRVFVK